MVGRCHSRITATSFWRCCLAVSSAVGIFVGIEPQASAYKCPQTPSPPKTQTYQGFLGRVTKVDNQEMPYRLFVPANYDANTAYPLVLYLHHAGLAGTDSHNESGWDNCVHLTSEIGSGDDYGGVFTHQAVDKGGQKFDTQKKYPHFVLAPHANSPAYGFGGGVAGSATGPEHPTRKILWAILEEVQKEFNIDRSRLYITGVSMGCYGTWDIIMRKPGVFAAASPQSCRGDPNTTLLAPLKDMPIWEMCGTNDSYYSGAQAMADAMKQVGATSATFTFTSFQGVGHSINDRGYDYPGFIDWMFAQRLTSVPGTGGAGGRAGTGGAGGTGGVGGMTGGSTGGRTGTGGAVGGRGGDAGSDAGTGGSSTGGTTGSGGMPSTGTGGGTVVPPGTGGAPPTSGTGGSGSDGAAGTGGKPGTSTRDAGTTPPVTGEEMAGCACTTGTTSHGTSLPSAILFLAALVFAARRRNRQKGAGVRDEGERR